MRRLIGGALAALTMVMFTPTAAHASGEWREEGWSPVDSRAEKSAEASCPNGSRVVASGGFTDGANGKVVLTGVVPSPTLDRVTAYAKALPGHAAPWAVVAVAVCGDPFDQTERVMGASFSGAARAACPDDKILWSTGFSVPHAATTTYVSAVEPAADLSSVVVRGVATPASAVIAYGICGTNLGYVTRGSASKALARQGTTALKVHTPEAYGRVFGAGVSANRSGLFVDGLGTGMVVYVDSWAVGRMAWLPGSGGLKTGASNAASEDEMTVYALMIGSWYD